MDNLEHAIKASRERDTEERAAGMYAASAYYCPQTDLLGIQMANGIKVEIPISLLQGLAHADRAHLSKVEITPSGMGLHWPTLDWDLSIPHVLMGSLGSKTWMREMASKGGSSRSEKKASASRANGKKGGRPKKQLTPEVVPD